MAAIKVQIVIKMNKFPACPGAMASAVNKAFGELGPQLLTEMQGRTPVDTGALRNSEQATVGSKQLTLTANTHYAGFVEFGTRYMSAQPYMGPTMAGAGGKVGAAIASHAEAAFGAL